MFHAQPLVSNYITGRRAWLLRDIPSGQFGDAWVASLVVVKARWFCKKAELLLVENLSTTQQYRDVRTVLKALGFKAAYSLRHGRRKTYRV